jgi:putative (di)nucleoside polyphosphate hydrolase
MEKVYRQNVGAVIIKDNLLWAGKRSDVDVNNDYIGWQFPQGGIEQNEDADVAVYREIFEETGIKKDKIELIKKMPKSLKYDFPSDKKIYTSYRGQEQYWYIFRFLGNNLDIDLSITDEKEFIRWDWKAPNFIIKNIVDFKKNTYLLLFDWMKKEKLINLT